ncbi:MAG: 50S ribosomal protein L32e [Thermoplasmatota archaeon]
MTKETFVEEVSKLPGVGPKTAEKLYDAGYTTIAKLAKATVDELVEKGIGKKTAEAILKGLEEQQAPGAKQQIEVVEEKGKSKKAEAVEKIEVVEKPYKPKIKAQLSDEMRSALAKRAIAYAKQPSFKRYHWYYKASLEQNAGWRRPRGPSNKQRRGFAYRPPRVKVGYGKPAMTRGLHPSGFREVLVYNVDDLTKIDPKTEAARIGGTVGKRKQKLIEAAAAEKSVRVLNPLTG